MLRDRDLIMLLCRSTAALLLYQHACRTLVLLLMTYMSPNIRPRLLSRCSGTMIAIHNCHYGFVMIKQQ